MSEMKIIDSARSNDNGTMRSIVSILDYPHTADVKHIGSGLGLVELPIPRPGKNQVLIKVAYAGVNRADTLQAAGHYPPPKGISNVLGLECSGTIVAICHDDTADDVVDAHMADTYAHQSGGQAVGKQSSNDDVATKNSAARAHVEMGARNRTDIAGVTRPLRIGDKVCAVVKGGAYGPYCVADKAAVFPLPTSYDLQKAAAIMEAAISAYYCLVERCRTRGGQTVLIHGGSGAVGTIAVQMAAAMQLNVITTAGSKERCKAVEKLARCTALDYHDDIVTQVKKLTDGKGVHCIIDVLGAGGLQANLDMLSYGGRLMILGLQKGVKTDINLLVPMNKALEIHAGTMRNMPREIILGLRERLIRDVWPMLQERDVVPVIDSVIPVGDAAKAHDRIRATSQQDAPQRPFGKIVLEVDGAPHTRE
ncbi:MAG: zinc-binding dehydrogenase [Actinomycetaceae bacterium]|nr:zinc-binding dehydrogenase [Actinomycetaceae bacterium]